MWVYALALFFGVVIGVITTNIILRTRYCGTLKIDHSNPEKDLYRFEIDDLDDLNKRKRVTLKVDHVTNLSQIKQTLL